MEIIKFIIATPISILIGWNVLKLIDKNLRGTNMIKSFKNDYSLLFVSFVIGMAILVFFEKST